MSARKLTNCIIVSITVWIKAWRLKPYLFGRRSFSFGGWVPHSGAVIPIGFRRLAVIEDCPPKADLWSARNMLVFFEPSYRVWIVTPISVERYPTLTAAMSAVVPLSTEPGTTQPVA